MSADKRGCECRPGDVQPCYACGSAALNALGRVGYFEVGELVDVLDDDGNLIGVECVSAPSTGDFSTEHGNKSGNIDPAPPIAAPIDDDANERKPASEHGLPTRADASRDPASIGLGVRRKPQAPKSRGRGGAAFPIDTL